MRHRRRSARGIKLVHVLAHDVIRVPSVDYDIAELVHAIDDTVLALPAGLVLVAYVI